MGNSAARRSFCTARYRSYKGMVVQPWDGKISTLSPTAKTDAASFRSSLPCSSFNSLMKTPGRPVTSGSRTSVDRALRPVSMMARSGCGRLVTVARMETACSNWSP